jgi:2-oxoisovalerate dehydrogenase E1 component alpha subunit
MTTDKDLNKIPKEVLLTMHEHMVKSRVLEERCIRLYKMGDAYFWIGGAGEEGFGVPLGMLADKGQGVKHDWLHLHYRCTPTLVAMGMPMIDSIRLIMNRATDPSTGGRNFSSHYAYPKWNIAPVTSPIEVQYIIALGTAWVQRRNKSKGITIVTGGDAGTAEGDFASCLIWSSRKGYELPMFIVVTNNRWGISTSFDGQHGETHIADRGKAFGIRTETINGNDPVESYLKQKECMDYIRKTGKPLLAEFAVSRLYGHSSASGANFVKEEADPVTLFEKRLIQAGLLNEKKAAALWEDLLKESQDIATEVRKEAGPKGETVWDHVYVGSENADWRKF